MKFRTIAAALVYNEQGNYLIAKTPDNLGVYTGQWGIPGGGFEEGETMEEALRREVREEVGLEITDIEPVYFRDDRQMKKMVDGSEVDVYMVYLIFKCKAASEKVILNEEFETYAWVDIDRVFDYNLNPATVLTFEMIGAKHNGKVPRHINKHWADHPQGKIPQGSVCICCGRYNARDSVTNVIAQKDGQILLIKRDIEPCKGMWALPGGYVDWNETLEEGAKRELWEEANVKADCVDLVAVYSDPTPRNTHDDHRQNIVHVYAAEVTDSGHAGDETTDVKWFDPNKLPRDIAFDHDKVINSFIKETHAKTDR